MNLLIPSNHIKKWSEIFLWFWEFCFFQSFYFVWAWFQTLLSEDISLVFLTHVAIWQLWKAKSLYHVGTFLLTWFFLPFEKFKPMKIKPEKNSYTIPKQIHAYYIFQGILNIFLNIYALLSIYSKLQTTETVQSSVSICCCLPFFQQILDPIILESIWSYNDLASILRY